MYLSGLDEIDRKMLDLLSQNARYTYSELGERLGLSRVAIKNRMDALKARVDRAQSAHRRAGFEELNNRVQAQELLCRRLEEGCAGLPDEGELHRLQKQLDAEQDALRTAQMEAAFGASEVEKPAAPQGFSGLSAEAARQQAAQDIAEYRQLREAQPPKKLLPLLLCLLAVAAGAGLFFVQRWAGLALAGAGMLLVSDILCHVVVAPLILPISAITSFVGAPIFIYLLFRGVSR